MNDQNASLNPGMADSVSHDAHSPLELLSKHRTTKQHQPARARQPQYGAVEQD